MAMRKKNGGETKCIKVHIHDIVWDITHTKGVLKAPKQLDAIIPCDDDVDFDDLVCNWMDNNTTRYGVWHTFDYHIDKCDGSAVSGRVETKTQKETTIQPDRQTKENFANLVDFMWDEDEDSDGVPTATEILLVALCNFMGVSKFNQFAREHMETSRSKRNNDWAKFMGLPKTWMIGDGKDGNK